MATTIKGTVEAPESEASSLGIASAAATAEARRRRRRIRLCQAVLVLLWLGSWEWASGRIIRPFFSSSPSAIGVRVYEWVVSGYIWVHLAATLQAMMVGLLIGASLGILLGFLLGRGEILSRIFEPFITAVYSLPKLALAPLFILWFGIGLLSKVVLVALIVFFLVFYNTYAGVRDVDRLHINALRIMGGSRRQVYTKVIMPSASVWVFTGLKLAVPYSLIGAIVGELISSNRGLGFTINNAAGFFDTTGVLAGLTFVAIISITINQSVASVGNRLMRWKGDAEGGVVTGA